MSRCYRPRCGRKADHGILFLSSGGVDYLWICEKHARAARAATDLVGGEPVYPATQWLRLAGPFGGLTRLFTKHLPPLLQPGEQVRAAGRGYLLPLLDTMPKEDGTAIATSNDRVLMISYGQIIFEPRWSDVRSYTVGPGTLYAGDEPRSYLQMRTGPKNASYMLWVRPQNEDDWLRELHEHNVPRE